MHFISQNTMYKIIESDMVDEISFMFPDIEKNLISSDLALTRNSEVTINRILDGQILPKSTENKTVHLNDHCKTDELPDLHFAEQQETTSLISKKFNFKKIKGPSSSSNIHDISSSESESECVDSQNLLQRISKQPPQSVGGTGKHTYHDLSDSDDSNRLPDLKDYCSKASYKNETSLCDVAETNTCISQGTDWQSTEFSSQSSKVSVSSESQNSNFQVSPGKCGKRKKKTPQEIEQSKNQALILKEAAKKRKEEEKRTAQLEREQKKKELEFEKQKKRALQEARKNAKPGECLKHFTVILSPGVVKEKSGAVILENLQKSDVKYDIQQQVHNNIITFWREVTEVKEVEQNNMKKLETVTYEKVEDTILLLLPIYQFVTLVYNYKQKNLGLGCLEDLHDHIVGIKTSLEGRDVTVIVQGLEKYFRDQKTKENRAFKKQVQSIDGEVVEAKKRKKKGEDDIIVSRLDVEEALIHLQLNDGCNIKFAELDQDVGKLVLHYTKAVAETPFKRDRLETGFTFHLSSSGSVHVDKEGGGLTKVWRQQLQQFPMVTAEVANAILAVYPSPTSLYNAYKECDPTTKKGERLLEDIEVRRGAGVMATTRRVGKELSRRLYQFFMSTDPDFVIL